MLSIVDGMMTPITIGVFSDVKAVKVFIRGIVVGKELSHKGGVLTRETLGPIQRPGKMGHDPKQRPAH